MTEDIQTVDMDYADAMEMLYRQQQTIKELLAENACIRNETLEEAANIAEAEWYPNEGKFIAKAIRESIGYTDKRINPEYTDKRMGEAD